MASVSRSRFFRGCLALFFMGTALIVGCYGVLVLVESFDGRGSSVGNSLLFGLALFFLGLSSIVLIVGLSNWRLAQSSREDAGS
jgi:hypothetical protein